MRFPWNPKAELTLAPVELTAAPPKAQFSVEIPPEMQQAMNGGGVIAPRISRAEALQVPAVLRARNLIAGTLGTLPIHVRDSEKNSARPTPLLDQIDPNVANAVTLAETYEDLLFEAVSWWRVTRFNFQGFPSAAYRVPIGSVFVAPTGGLPSIARVTPDMNFPARGQVYIDGIPVPDDEIIRFDSPNPPLLRHAAKAIRTCLRLDSTASMYAEAPTPLGYLSPEDGTKDLSPEEAIDLMTQWEDARRRHAWAWIGGGIKAGVLQWNAEQIQLADQRQHAVLEIARATGIDPEDLGVSTTSRTYQNSEDRRRALIDFTLKPYMVAVEQRLSMNDVLPRGYEAKVNLDSFLRSDTKTRMEAYVLGKQVGAYTEDEIRELEDRPALTPAEKAAIAPSAPASAGPTIRPQVRVA